MTIDFMLGVQSNIYWLPRTHEIRLLNCGDPPAKHALAMMLAEKMNNHPAQGEPFDTMFRRTALKIKAYPPNKDWMLAVLATLDSDNLIFNKGYEKPKVDARGNEVDHDLVENIDDFFTGLPAAKSKRKAAKNINFVTKGTIHQ